MTETVLGGLMPERDGGFDEWYPANIAHLVACLASDAASDVSGQNFVVFGGERLGHGRIPPGGRAYRDSMWTPEELAGAKGDLFKEVSSGLPKFSFF